MIDTSHQVHLQQMRSEDIAAHDGSAWSSLPFKGQNEMFALLKFIISKYTLKIKNA